MPAFAVTYLYTDDPFLLDEHRPAHRDFLRTLLPAAGRPDGGVRLLSAGPWAGGVSGALLIFAAPDERALGRALDVDPFRVVGAIARRDIREWLPVLGDWAGL